MFVCTLLDLARAGSFLLWSWSCFVRNHPPPPNPVFLFIKVACLVTRRGETKWSSRRCRSADLTGKRPLYTGFRLGGSRGLSVVAVAVAVACSNCEICFHPPFFPFLLSVTFVTNGTLVLVVGYPPSLMFPLFLGLRFFLFSRKVVLMARELPVDAADPLLAMVIAPGCVVIGTVLSAYNRMLGANKDRVMGCYDIYAGEKLKMVTCQVWDLPADTTLVGAVVAFRVGGIRTYNDNPQLSGEVLGILPEAFA